MSRSNTGPDDDPRDGNVARAADALKQPAASKPKLFDLDAPGENNNEALGAVPASVLDTSGPANDASISGARAKTQGSPAEAGEDAEAPAASDLIQNEFSSLASTSQFEPSAQAPAEQLAPIRLLTHVATTASFDVTLKLAKPSDTPEARRTRLTGRFKSATAAYKLLSGLGLGSVESKELVDLFNTYESRLRAVVPPEESKQDADSLHTLIPVSALDELERQAHKLEERLLAYDDSLSESDFYARVARDRQPPKVLLRYARLLASRRFNIGYRRDRFEYLALQLLIQPGPDKRRQLLPRDKAESILNRLLSGLSQQPPAEERGPATLHLREALDRLAEINSPKAFFESEFFLDLHGYKISMRDQIASPEFLYLCAALDAEIYNRLVAWSQAGTPSLQALESKLQAQKRAAEEVFSNFRRPKGALVPAQPSPQPPPQGTLPRDRDKPATRERLGSRAKDKERAAPEGPPAKPQRRAQRRSKSGAVPESSARSAWKLAALLVVIVASLGSVTLTSGLLQLSPPPTVLTQQQLERLSPLLVSGTLLDQGKRLEGMVARPQWSRLSRAQRRERAYELAANLKAMGVHDAQIRAHRQPVVVIEYDTVVQIDGSSP